MSDEHELTPEVGQEVVADAQAADGQVEDQTKDTQEPGDQPEPAKEDREKETAKERRARRDAAIQRQRADLEQRLAESDARREAIIRAAQAEQEPRRQEFATDMDHAAARAVWQHGRMQAERAVHDVEQQSDEVRRDLEVARRVEAEIAGQRWEAQMEDAKSRYTDFEKVALHDAPIDQRMAQVVLATDNAADVAYWLGKNPDVGHAIAQMNPVAQAIEIGRISATITAPKPRTTSSAPPPISPGKGGGAGTKSPDNMTADEYRAWRASGGKF